MKIHLALVDPARWGQPLFVDGSGRPVYPGRGADGTDDDGEGEGDSGADDDTDGDDDGGDETKKGDKGKPGPADEEVLRKKIRLADKRAAEAERKLKDLEDKDKSALEVATRKLEEMTKANEELTAKLREQALVSAFAMVNEHEWADPQDALDLARRRGFLDEVQDEDGTVDEKVLKRKLAEFAKAKPNMLKNKKAAQEEEEAPKGPTGTTTGSGRKKGAADSPTEAELLRRYSALRR